MLRRRACRTVSLERNRSSGQQDKLKTLQRHLFDTPGTVGLAGLQLGPWARNPHPARRSFCRISLQQGATSERREWCNAVKTILPSRTCNLHASGYACIAALRPLQAATKGKLIIVAKR